MEESFGLMEMKVWSPCETRRWWKPINVLQQDFELPNYHIAENI